MTGPDEGIEAQARAVARRLAAAGLPVATAESCTGGGVAAALTAVEGSSAWFRAGIVAYALDAKERLLGVPHALLERHGAVSEPVVRAMAEGVAARAGARVAVATSGIAGPSGGEVLQPVGTVWFAWLLVPGTGDPTLQTARQVFDGDRGAVVRAAVVTALAGLGELPGVRG